MLCALGTPCFAQEKQPQSQPQAQAPSEPVASRFWCDLGPLDKKTDTMSCKEKRTGNALSKECQVEITQIEQGKPITRHYLMKMKGEMKEDNVSGHMYCSIEQLP